MSMKFAICAWTTHYAYIRVQNFSVKLRFFILKRQHMSSQFQLLKMNSHFHVLKSTRSTYLTHRHWYKHNFQRLFVRHFPQDLIVHPVYDSLIIQKHYVFHARNINWGLFADFSDKLFRGSFLEVHGTEDIVVPRIPFLSVAAKVNAECCLCQSGFWKVWFDERNVCGMESGSTVNGVPSSTRIICILSGVGGRSNACMSRCEPRSISPWFDSLLKIDGPTSQSVWNASLVGLKW